ncbi:DUF3054 domain-containing protein [Gordonia phosphorivorans]|uniref:DUF3054 domain-containing protein n=1 Tax=Gordonia phosphorivorans TaxID=1056982 RepID=A0ABV6HE71_9ACTN
MLAFAALADFVAVIVFAAVGRSSHAEALSPSGVWETAWPFLVGAAVGWLIVGLLRRTPVALAPGGVIIWISTVVVGMVVRWATDSGTATAFIIVATVSTALLLLGWRLIARIVSAKSSASSPEAAAGQSSR